MSMITDYITKTQTAIGNIVGIESSIQDFADACIESLGHGNKIIFCGNGGSAADSQHLSAELMGRFLKDREPLAAMALTVDTSALTAIGNDYGYDQVFARQLSGIGRTGDVLVGLSTSGNSANIVNAFHKANSIGILTVAMTGNRESALSKLADITIFAPSGETNHIQECHITIGHLVCKIVEEKMFP
jgi:D-sedoheptulose 7-phosphate isomerase